MRMSVTMLKALALKMRIEPRLDAGYIDLRPMKEGCKDTRAA